jgi:thiamine pyrophosphokinase
VPKTVVVFAGGSKPSGRVLALIPGGASVVAADRGADHALALGLRVDVAVGDFDSISPAGLAELERSGARVERYPVAKDACDLELALDAALSLRPRRILVVGGAGGRLDHLVGELLLVAAEAYAGSRSTRSWAGRRCTSFAASGCSLGDPGSWFLCSRCTVLRPGW